MSYKVITPASAVITTADLKTHMRVDQSSEDALIASYHLAAMEYCQHYTGYAIGTQTLEIALDAFPAGDIELPFVPAASITSVTYVDTSGATQTVSPSLYSLNDYSSQKHEVALAYDEEWPDTRDIKNAVKVRYVAGSASIPSSIRSALMLLTAHFYENREASTEKRLSTVPLGVNELLNTQRVWGH